MNAERFAELLGTMLEDNPGLDAEDDADADAAIRDVASFRDTGVLTSNAGLVVTLLDGTEFQLTIVLSRRGRS